jgi:chemotaxis protein methyltransferase CheR
MLEGDGTLMLGAAETVVGISDAFRPYPDKRGLYQLNPARTGRANAAGALQQSLRVVAAR